MKAVDLHIHTLSTKSDSRFDFSIEVLENYVKEMKLDIIAITNHNCFDLKQYREIKEKLKIKVLPGIEINFERGHLLLISDCKELDVFETKCKQVNEKIVKCTDSINKNELLEIFGELSNYLLIPHNPKKPKVPLNIIRSFSNEILAIEVGSIKDFLREYKENTEYVPLWFSDMRASQNNTKCKYGRVYIDIENDDLASIKYALKDRSKIRLSYEESNTLFPINNKGFQISTGLNVVLGARSSGKSYFLDEIEQNNDNVKYLKQFSLLDKKEENSKKFNVRLNNENSVIDEKLFKEFKGVINDVIAVNLAQIYKEMDEYAKSLIKFAEEEERRDIFSRAKLFTQSAFILNEKDALDKLIESVEIIIKNKKYTEIISKYVNKDDLSRLIIELAEIAIKNQRENILKQKVNQIIKSIKEKLQLKSTSNKVDEINFREYIINKNKIEKFNKICELVKIDKNYEIEKIGKFRLVMSTGAYSRVSEIKERTKTKDALSDAFKKYDNGYNFLQELKNSQGVPRADYYKYFVNVKFDIVNEFGLSASGGERAEYNLLNEIKSSLKYDILLIDEPESSFDNPFLKQEVNALIKDISKKMPVVLVTHNNTVGLSINPDYLLHTSNKFDKEERKVSFDIFKGRPDSKYLISEKGDKITTKDVLMKSLEAGEKAYENRREIYELYENRE